MSRIRRHCKAFELVTLKHRLQVGRQTLDRLIKPLRSYLEEAVKLTHSPAWRRSDIPVRTTGFKIKISLFSDVHQMKPIVDENGGIIWNNLMTKPSEDVWIVSPCVSERNDRRFGDAM